MAKRVPPPTSGEVFDVLLTLLEQERRIIPHGVHDEFLARLLEMADIWPRKGVPLLAAALDIDTCGPRHCVFQSGIPINGTEDFHTVRITYSWENLRISLEGTCSNSTKPLVMHDLTLTVSEAKNTRLLAKLMGAEAYDHALDHLLPEFTAVGMTPDTAVCLTTDQEVDLGLFFIARGGIAVRR